MLWMPDYGVHNFQEITLLPVELQAYVISTEHENVVIKG